MQKKLRSSSLHLCVWCSAANLRQADIFILGRRDLLLTRLSGLFQTVFIWICFVWGLYGYTASGLLPPGIKTLKKEKNMNKKWTFLSNLRIMEKYENLLGSHSVLKDNEQTCPVFTISFKAQHIYTGTLKTKTSGTWSPKKLLFFHRQLLHTSQLS